MRSSSARAALVALLALASVGVAERAVAEGTHPRARAGVTVYAEEMDTQIVTANAAVGASLPGELDLDVTWDADVISSASVDVVTAATTAVDDLRNQIGASLRGESVGRDLDLDVGYAYSFEKDSYSHILHGGARQGFSDDNVVLGLDYGVSYNRMGIRDEPQQDWRALWVHSLDLGGTFVLDPRTTLEVIYTGGLAHGYLANRYRRVPITWRQDLRGAEWVEEAAPDVRLRNAFTVRGQRALASGWYVGAEYRFYVDTWGIVGNTLQLSTTFELARGLTLRVRARGAQQGEASFYQPMYTSLTDYRTRDRRLSAHLSGLAGIAVAWDLGPLLGLEAFELRAGVDGIVYLFDDYIVPQLDSFGRATWYTLGDLTGVVANLQLGVRL